MGIDFLDPKSIRQREVWTAASEFFNLDSDYSLAEEAFDRDPHTPREDLYNGGFRVSVRSEPSEHLAAEVVSQKHKEDRLQTAYDEARQIGRSFEAQAEVEYDAMVRWVLGPIADADFTDEFARKQAAATVARWPGQALSRYIAVAERGQFAESLLAKFPDLSERRAEFAASEELRQMPALYYPAIVRAALATMRSRRAKPGDGYDIDHLANGLSRCDMVTADSGMAQLVVNHKLVAPDCQLFGFRDLSAFHVAVDDALVEIDEG